MTLAEARAAFLARVAARGSSPSMTLMRRLHVDEFLGFLSDRGVEALESVTGRMVEDYRAWALAHKSPWSGRRMTAGSVAQRLGTVGFFFRQVSPGAAGRLFPRRGPAGRSFPVPTGETRAAALARPDVGTPCGLRDRAMLELLYSSGLSPEDVARLDVGEVEEGGQGRAAVPGKEARALLARYFKESRPVLAKLEGEPALFVTVKGTRFKPAEVRHLAWRYAWAVSPRSA